MIKLLCLLLFPFLFIGCESGIFNNSQNKGRSTADGNTTNISFDPETPILDIEEVDWLDISPPTPEVEPYDTTFSYDLSVDFDYVERLTYTQIQRRELGEWVDITPEEIYSESSYEVFENDMGEKEVTVIIFYSTLDYGSEPYRELGQYRAIEVFTHWDYGETEPVQVAIPFEVVAFDISENHENPDFLEVEIPEEIISPDTEVFTYTLTNNHESEVIVAGSNYRLDIMDHNSWQVNTPSDFLSRSDFTLDPGESHDVHLPLQDYSEELLQVGEYRIGSQLYLGEKFSDEFVYLTVEYKVEE